MCQQFLVRPNTSKYHSFKIVFTFIKKCHIQGTEYLKLWRKGSTDSK